MLLKLCVFISSVMLLLAQDYNSWDIQNQLRGVDSNGTNNNNGSANNDTTTSITMLQTTPLIVVERHEGNETGNGNYTETETNANHSTTKYSPTEQAECVCPTQERNCPHSRWDRVYQVNTNTKSKSSQNSWCTIAPFRQPEPEPCPAVENGVRAVHPSECIMVLIATVLIAAKVH